MTATRAASRVLAFALVVHASPARAEPTTEVTSCAFDSAALSSALALEDRAAGKSSAGAVHVACAADGTASVRVEHGERTITRTVDLADVPASLAPRVVALVIVAMLEEPRPEPRPSPESHLPASDSPPPSPNAPLPSPAPPPSPPPESHPESAEPSPPSPYSTPDAVTRPAVLSSRSLHPRGISARVLARIHDSTTALWGASVSGTLGPAALGITAATARIEHSLGTITPYLVAARADLTIACTGAACIGASGELGALVVHASAMDPTVVSARSMSATYLHAATEVSFTAQIGGLDIAAVAALGTSRGVIARVDSEAAAVLAGWTLGAALEIRR